MAKSKAKAAPETIADAALKKIADDTLKRVPALQAVHVTADGTPFTTLNAAQNHAKNLTSQIVVSVEREPASVETPEILPENE